MNIKLSKAKEIALVVILILIAINLTVSYSYFSVNTTHDNTLSTISGHVNCLDITYEEQNSLNLSGQYPVSDEWALANMTPVTITVENNCEDTDERINYTLALSTLRNATGFINDNQIRMHLKRTMYGDTEKIFKNTDYVSSLNQLEPGNALDFITQDLQTRGLTSSYTTITNYVLDSTDIGAGETNTYRLFLWIDYYEGDTTHTGLNDNTTQNKQYKTALSLVLNADDNVEAGYMGAFETLAGLCNNDATVVPYTGKVTDDVSQIGAGVDATKVCAFTSNTNNNLVFANHCWQIRRTTETGGIKIQYNGEPTLGTSNGKTTYDCGTTRPYHVGGIETTYDLNGTKTYGTGYTTSVSGTTTTFTLTGTSSVQVTSSNAATVIPTLKDKYICGTGTTTTCTNTDLKKIGDQSSGTQAYVYESTHRDSLGKIAFNSYSSSVSDVGYMYNIRYSVSRHSMIKKENMLSSVTLYSNNLTTYGNYYFGDGFTLSGNNHVLTNAVKGNTLTDYPESWKGWYQCDSSSSSSCRTAYYISGLETSGTNSIMYRATIGSGKEYNDSAYKYLIGTGLQDNGDGTVTLTGTVREIIQKDWYDTYNTVVGMYVCMPGYYTYNSSTGANTCSDNGEQDVGVLRYITETTSKDFTATIIYKYGYGVELASGNNYALVEKANTQSSLQFLTKWLTEKTSNCFENSSTTISSCGYKALTYSHYSCFNLSGVCSTYYYIYYTSNSISNSQNADLYRLPISEGKYVSTDLTDTNNVLYDMLNANDLNTTSSTIKDAIDLWYVNNLLNTNYEILIDTNSVYCNDRRVASFGGWNPDGGVTNSGYTLDFTESTSTSNLGCNRTLDAFSTGNNSARLIYPIGLMSVPEMNILGNNLVRSAANPYWLSSPQHFAVALYYSARESRVSLDGYLNTFDTSSTFSVRPAVSLNSTAEFSSGTGSTSDPFIVKGSEMTP